MLSFAEIFWLQTRHPVLLIATLAPDQPPCLGISHPGPRTRHPGSRLGQGQAVLAPVILLYIQYSRQGRFLIFGCVRVEPPELQAGTAAGSGLAWPGLAWQACLQQSVSNTGNTWTRVVGQLDTVLSCTVH